VSLSDNERIVVTGLGGVTPVGANMQESWQAIKEGRDGIIKISDTDLATQEGVMESGAKVIAPAAKVDIYDDPLLFEHRKKLRTNWWHPSAKLGFLALYESLRDADLLDPSTLRLDAEKADRFRTGFYLGSTFSGADQLGDIVGLSPENVNLKHLLKYLPARAATAPAMPLGLNGPGGMIGEECASGGSAIRLGAKEMLPYWGLAGDADIMVVGGTDAELSRYNLMLFGSAKGTVDPTDDPSLASRPLDKERGGLVMGEASGALVLETLSHAKSRGVTEDKIYAELVGFANLTEAANETRAGEDGARKVIETVLRMAGVQVHEVAYFNGHLTSTPDGDFVEVTVAQQSFKNVGIKPSNIWLTSTKGATGHTMGAAGAIEAAFSILALRDNTVPPGLKLNNPMEETQGLNLSPLKATILPSIDVAVSTSFGFGGTAAALAFRKYKA
jgi:3-oxoacyl-[acyl-carrier-protein] synthase II